MAKRLVGIHFIETMDKYQRISGHEFESGEWSNIADDKADELVGGKIYLHTSKTAASYIGGRILSYRSIPSDFPDKPDLRIFRFRFMAATTDKRVANWGGQEQHRDYVEDQ